MIYGARMVPYLLPAGWVAEVPLAEDDPVERSRELQVHRHPALLAGDVQTSDLEFCLLVSLSPTGATDVALAHCWLKHCWMV